MTLFNDNFAIIKKRWPELASTIEPLDFSHLNVTLVQGQAETISVGHVQLSSRHDRLTEAKLQSHTVDVDSASVTIFGTGLGDLPVDLLTRSKLRHLQVCILNEYVFKAVITHTDQRQWLNHPSVCLKFASECPVINHPFIAIPSELVLVSDRNARVANHINTELQGYWIDRRHRQGDEKTQRRFKQNESLIAKDKDVAELIMATSNTRALIVGTGPTLESQIKNIKSLIATSTEPPLLIAVDTAMRALCEEGIYPDVVCTMDEFIHENHLSIEHSAGCKLVYFPQVQNNTLIAWLGERYTAFGQISLYDELCQQYPKGRLYLGGSVIHPAIDLAKQMGVVEIFLFGCDFCFVGSKTHSYWGDEELGLNGQVSGQGSWLINGYGERVDTVPNLATYLSALESYLLRQPHLKVFNSSRQGAAIAGTQYLDEVSL